MNRTFFLRRALFTLAAFTVFGFFGCKQQPKDSLNDGIERFIVTFGEEGAGGTLSARYKNGKEISSGEKAEKGKIIVFTAEPKAGYAVKEWKGIKASPANASSAELAVTKAVTVRVSFVKNSEPEPEKVKITFAPEGIGGGLSARIKDGENLISPALVEKGKVIVFTAKPAEEYAVESWTGVNAVPPNALSAELTVTAAAAVTVKFVKNSVADPEKATVTFGTDGIGGVLIAKVKGGNLIISPAQVEKGKTVVFTASANPAYAVESWSGVTAIPADAESVEAVINGDITVKVKFKSALPPEEKVRLTFGTDGAGGSLTAKIKETGAAVNSSPSEIKKGTTVVFTAIPDTGFTVEGWTGVNADPVNATKTQLTVNADTEVKVKFKSTGSASQKYDELVKVTPPASGIVGKNHEYPMPSNKAYFNGVFIEGRTVKLSPYEIGKYEVSYSLWKEVFDWGKEHGYSFANEGKKGSEGSGEDCEPVTEVTWRDCIIWCNAYTEMKKGNDGECVYRKSENDSEVLKNSTHDDVCDKAFADLTKKGFRLPTEAEWEFAARYQPSGSAATNAEEYGAGVWLTKMDSASGGRKPVGFKGVMFNGSVVQSENTAVWEELRDEFIRVSVSRVWWNGKKNINIEPKPEKTARPGSKAANDLGIFDMSGNVYEWCWDLYGDDGALRIGEETNPKGAESNSDNNRVTRGGCYNDFLATGILTGYRNPYVVDVPINSYGFRIAKTAE